MQSYATNLVQGNVVRGNAGLESQPRGEPVTSLILECHWFPYKGSGLKSSAVQGKGLNKVGSSTSSVSIWESSVATKSMLIMCLNLWEKQEKIDGFLMFDATKSSSSFQIEER